MNKSLGSGFEYGYRLWVDKSMIERFSLYNLVPEIKFVFEMRTYFVVKRSDGGGGDEIVDSERVEKGLSCVENMESGLEFLWSRRLQDYWRSCDHSWIDELARKAADFAGHKQKELDDVDDLPFIPIAVELDICTVQKEGEPISDAFARAIRPQHLFPLSLYVNFDGLEEEKDCHGSSHDDDLLLDFVSDGMEIVKVENFDYEEAREYWREVVCRLCGHNPTIGAQLARLPGCPHRFHHHCIVEWLLQYEKSCPTCRRPITYEY